MVHGDHWALSQWFAHYSRHLGARNLFIIAHGRDPFIKMICPKANIIPVPRDDLSHFDTTRAQLLNGFRSGLLATYDWVIQTDADELICLDPEQHASFEDLFSAQSAPALFAMGINIAERKDDPTVPDGDRALPLRPCGVFSGHYSKAWAASQAIGFRRHGLHLGPRRLGRTQMVLPKGVYLAHLKFASRDALTLANSTRKTIAAGDEPGLPGPAWQKPLLAAQKFWNAVEGLPLKPWTTAEPEAVAAVSQDPLRDTKTWVLRARNIRFDFKTELPERILNF